MAKRRKKTQKKWTGDVRLSVNVSLAGIPAKNKREAKKRIMDTARNCLTTKRIVFFWRGRPWYGKPAAALRNPEIEFWTEEAHLVNDLVVEDGGTR